MTERTKINQLIDRLFRQETGKLVAVLTRIFGTENLELAEDVVQDSLIEAIKQWSFKGIPDNPSGWLNIVAKYKALNVVNREKYKTKYTTDVVHLLQSAWTVLSSVSTNFISCVTILRNLLKKWTLKYCFRSVEAQRCGKITRPALPSAGK